MEPLEPNLWGSFKTTGCACQGDCGFENGYYSGYCSKCWKSLGDEKKRQANECALELVRSLRVVRVVRLQDSFVEAITQAHNEARANAFKLRYAMKKNYEKIRFGGNVSDNSDASRRLETEIALAYSGVAKVCVDYRQSPPSVRDNAAWTLLGIAQLYCNFSRDVRWVLYCAFVRVQYCGAAIRLEPIQRILEPQGRWFKPIFNEMPFGVCVDPNCNDKLDWPSALSKLLFESVLEQHFKMAHIGKVHWSVFLERVENCSHEVTVIRPRAGDACEFAKESKTARCCSLCGATVATESHWE
jgi:hypothetical protein